jgi:2-dehydro-3-deoxyphosphogluconate aldolase/(4S)-4-hydroxy-2-oxoglutarate aldolase
VGEAQSAASHVFASREQEVLDRLASVRVVPVASIEDSTKAELVGTLLAGGIACIEVTFRTESALESIERCSRLEGLLTGAGTVLSPEQASAAAAAGAAFAVSPGTNDEVVAACRELELPIVPGVATPTEIERARGLRLRVMKVFPAESVGGVRFVQAVSTVYPDVRYLPTGGITAANMHDYLALPSVLAVGGSWLTASRLIADGDHDEIARLAREAAEIAA